MTLIDDPFVQLVAQIAYRRQSDLLKCVLGEERCQRADDEDQEKGGENALPFVGGISVPPLLISRVSIRDIALQPIAFCDRTVALHDLIHDSLLPRFMFFD